MWYYHRRTAATTLHNPKEPSHHTILHTHRILPHPGHLLIAASPNLSNPRWSGVLTVSAMQLHPRLSLDTLLISSFLGLDTLLISSFLPCLTGLQQPFQPFHSSTSSMLSRSSARLEFVTVDRHSLGIVAVMVVNVTFAFASTFSFWVKLGFEGYPSSSSLIGITAALMLVLLMFICESTQSGGQLERIDGDSKRAVGPVRDPDPKSHRVLKSTCTFV